MHCFSLSSKWLLFTTFFESSNSCLNDFLFLLHRLSWNTTITSRNFYVPAVNCHLVVFNCTLVLGVEGFFRTLSNICDGTLYENSADNLFRCSIYPRICCFVTMNQQQRYYVINLQKGWLSSLNVFYRRNRFYLRFLQIFVQELSVSVNPLHVTGLFLYALKISENIWFSDVFRGYRKKPVTWSGLSSSSNLLNPLNTNPTKSSNTLKQFVRC